MLHFIILTDSCMYLLVPRRCQFMLPFSDPWTTCDLRTFTSPHPAPRTTELIDSHFGFRMFAHSGVFTFLTTLNLSLHLELLSFHTYGLEYMRCPLMKPLGL